MTLYAVIPALGLVAILQATLLPRLTLLGLKPDLMLVTVLAWSLLRGNPEALWWGFVGGVFLDLLSGLPFGVNTFALLVVVGLAGSIPSSVYGQHVAVPLLSAVVGSLFYYATTLLLFVLVGKAFPAGSFALRAILPVAFLNTAAMALVFPGLRWLSRRLTRDRIEI